MLQNYIFIFIIFLIIIYLVYYENIYQNFTCGYSNDFNDYIEPIIIDNFITEQEAKYILDNTKDKFEDSTIIGGKNSSIRKSKNTWIKKDDNVVKNIFNRLLSFTQYPFENAEDLQVVKYEPDGYYNEHHDSCCDETVECEEFIKRGGQRILTVLIYLNDDYEGGSTRFHNLNKDYKPKKYSAVLFHPLNKSENKCHNNALHSGMPIISGEKYIASIWIHEKTFI